MLQLKHVRKSYQKKIVLDIPSLELESDCYWIRGANGSGKTTLLKIVAGLIPFEGDILFRGISLQQQPMAYRRYTGWSEAEPLFPEFMTGMELLSLFRGIRKSSKQATAALLECFNMQDYIHTATGTYSAGMTKKLSLVLALLGNPLLVVLDEPLITLDPAGLDALCHLIPAIHAEHGTTFLMSSHQPLENGLSLPGRELIVNNRHISL